MQWRAKATFMKIMLMYMGSLVTFLCTGLWTAFINPGNLSFSLDSDSFYSLYVPTKAILLLSVVALCMLAKDSPIICA